MGVQVLAGRFKLDMLLCHCEIVQRVFGCSRHDLLQDVAHHIHRGVVHGFRIMGLRWFGGIAGSIR